MILHAGSTWNYQLRIKRYGAGFAQELMPTALHVQAGQAAKQRTEPELQAVMYSR